MHRISSQQTLDIPIWLHYSADALEECIVKSVTKYNKNRPTDRVQIDPSIVIGVARLAAPTGACLPGNSLPGNRLRSLELAYSEGTGTLFAGEWPGVHGGIPL